MSQAVPNKLRPEFSFAKHNLYIRLCHPPSASGDFIAIITITIITIVIITIIKNANTVPKTTGQSFP